MGATAGKWLGKKSESNRKRRNLDLRFSPSSREREEHKRLSNGEIEQNVTSSTNQTALYDLPLEILDMILQKSYLHWILNSPMKQSDEDVIRSLKSVDICFNQRITRKRFKREIWRYWKDFYGKTKKRSAFIRNNRNYLLENIQPNDELIASLLFLNCLTQEQSHIIQRQNSTQDKNAELLYVAESFDEANFSDFIKCLRETNQKTVTRIMENGGGAIKIKLQSRGEKRTASMESKLLHQKIDDLRSKTKPRSHQTDKIINQLKDEGLEILNSHLNKQTVIVWIWCHSQSALQNIQELYESNQLIDVFVETFQTPISMLISVDRNQFKKTIVECPFFISFIQRIKIQEIIDMYIYRMVKLRNKIYILFKSLPTHPPIIHVFEDRSPFHWQKEIKLTVRGYPDDIGSSERDNCLYVTDFLGAIVWKITRAGDSGQKIITWLTIDFVPTSLSVSADGQFLAFNKSSSSLMIYGSDATLIRSIQLPTEIRNPHHAVKTSIGNFVILHQRIQAKVKSESVWTEQITRWGICEVARDGQNLMVIRRFIPSNEQQQLKNPDYLLLDSDNRVFVADTGNDRVILLDSDLRWDRILIPTGEKEETTIRWPNSLCINYEEEKQLIVGGDQVYVYAISGK